MSYHIKYRQLKAFALVVELGSFKAAAERLSVTQPSLSGLVKELESDLGVALFERTTRTVSPTEAGRTFHEQIKGALDHLEDAYHYTQEVGTGDCGKLAIAALPSLCSGIIIDKLAEFQRLHPKVRISLSERGHGQVQEAVRRGEAELGIGSLLQPDPKLVFQPLFSDRLMIMAPRGHPLVKGRATWKSLEKYDVIFMMAGPAEHALRASEAKVVPAFEVEQTSTALAMVRHGMGLTVLPSSIVPNFNTDALVALPIHGKLTTRKLGTIRRRNTAPSAAARAFAELLKGVQLP